MPAPRDHAGVAAVNGKLYVLGGYGPETVATVFEFDPGSSTWSTKAPMLSPRGAFAVAVIGSRIHCVGGVSGQGQGPYVHGVGAVTLNGWIHMIGGGRLLGTAGTTVNEAFMPE